jgi:RHS repeat-associated protein
LGSRPERYVYDPYGKVTIYDGTWTNTRSASSYDNAILYCGYYGDSETGLYDVRNRYLHPTLGRWLSRDPWRYADRRHLYQYARGTPCCLADARGTSPLDIRARKIKAYIAMRQYEMASNEAYLLYGTLATYGGLFEPLAADLMRNWLDGAPQDPYPIPGKHVKGAMLDDKAKGRLDSPRKQMTEVLCSWPLDPVDGSGQVSNQSFQLEATEGVYYHAFGTFAISFTGSYECKKGVCAFDGTWRFSDRYDWHKGLTADVGGTEVADDWALLVERFHGAKPFDETGSYAGKINVTCACEEEDEGQEEGGAEGPDGER